MTEMADALRIVSSIDRLHGVGVGYVRLLAGSAVDIGSRMIGTKAATTQAMFINSRIKNSGEGRESGDCSWNSLYK